MYKAILVVSFLALCGVFGACSDTTAPIPVPGTYVLATINGSTVPYSYSMGDTTVTVVADTIILYGNNSTFRWHGEAHVMIGGIASTNFTIVASPASRTGAYLYTGNSNVYRLDYVDTNVFAPVSKGVITLTPPVHPASLDQSTYTWVYRRQD